MLKTTCQVNWWGIKLLGNVCFLRICMVVGIIKDEKVKKQSVVFVESDVQVPKKNRKNYYRSRWHCSMLCMENLETWARLLCCAASGLWTSDQNAAEPICTSDRGTSEPLARHTQIYKLWMEQLVAAMYRLASMELHSKLKFKVINENTKASLKERTPDFCVKLTSSMHSGKYGHVW